MQQIKMPLEQASHVAKEIEQQVGDAASDRQLLLSQDKTGTVRVHLVPVGARTSLHEH